MNGAKLVSIGVAHIGKVILAQRIITQSWRVFDGYAAMCHRRVMKLLHQLRCLAFECDGSSVCTRGRLIVDGLADAERISTVPVEQANMTCRRNVADRAALRADHAKNRIVETFGAFDVVAANHDVIEHSFALSNL